MWRVWGLWGMVKNEKSSQWSRDIPRHIPSNVIMWINSNTSLEKHQMEQFYLLVLLQLVHTRTHTHTPLSCTIFHASDFFTGKLPHTHTALLHATLSDKTLTHAQHCNVSHRTLSHNLSPTMSHYISHLSHPIFTPLLYLLEEVDMGGYPILSFLLEHRFGRIM